MTKPIRVALVVCVLLLVLTFHLAVAWQDFATLARNGFLYDDSFYAFQIARNIATGQGMTFDGIHPTNGFQPLYVFLLVPLYVLFGGNPAHPIYIALSLLSVFTLLTAYLIYRIANRYVGRAASLFAALIWAFSPIVTRQSANGLETALAAFMIAVSIFYYLERVRSAESPNGERFLALGLLLGLAALTRIDSLLLVLVILLDYLLMLRRKPVPFTFLRRLSFLPLGVILVYGPWFVFSVVASGSPLQDSGAATRYISLAYAPYFGYGVASLNTEGPDPAFVWAHVMHSFAVLKVTPPLHVVFRSFEKLGIWFGGKEGFHLAGNLLGFLMLIGASMVVLRWRKQERKRRRGEISFLILFSAILIISYSLYIFGAFFFLRYYYPIYLVACIYLAFLIQDFIDWLSRRSLLFRRAALVGLGIYAATFSYFSYSQAFRSRPIYPFYDIAKWVDINTYDSEKIGVFQCGAIGYLSHREVINLDGKVNRDALEALKKGCLGEYVQEEGIDVVIDNASVIDLLLGPACKKMADSSTRIQWSASGKGPGWVAVRLHPAKNRDTAEALKGSSTAASVAPSLPSSKR
ncbi:MAG: DUF2723 domain-containing protein [Candidatus Latescibacteria bacterium]|nr:DUF2723 domain-containing protein [Candidatus Latescibacterota bacterium]NIM66523.1 DUF2723 domain-containing protein [Candidatus Latescibacterota bacterium]NIO03003.1 DUF2723 domain-containing protein [Candidatus Latescibacterota bacterium]NIO30138.1 DUF2723 domain-containing protein [Candidatus Latescibacterota bacterium]NIO57757.1 DUF2723 domain-containing protein [Candidatus Latescibacterota bacterium]